ncbi:Uncharacterised protein [Clostridioides difficile]|uniref:Uncharacterized protein n=1 Tax=Clostridioides difficile TaxID=1496 RepID=A0AAX3GWX6_CLODI|nr:hypothetical protein CDIF29020_01562 [Clostridioides difficile]SHO36279.1 hypothetical protein CDIFFM120_01659 [Clostridioides difficile M120]AXU90068.1 hypothetical protein CDIF29747_01535 [Clostridioides difficile]OMK40660.1 hypothetical protein BER34_002300 [Clostridioides difficile]OMK64738.1 hypothetical protein BER35_001618 [Clostridioides difficile]
MDTSMVINFGGEDITLQNILGVYVEKIKYNKRVRFSN